MNIVQLHDRVRFWTDTVASTRFSSEQIDLSIRNSIREITNEKYDHSQLNHRGDSYQRTQRVRDELSNLTKELDSDGSLNITNNTGYVLVNNFPSDYKYLLAMAIFVGSTRYNCWPLSRDQENVIDANPFRRVQSGLFTKCYYIESSEGYKVYHPFSISDPSKVLIAYLKDSYDVFYGYEKGAGESMGSGTPFICSLTPTNYKGVDYPSGTELTTDGVDMAITYGLAVTGYTNPQINGFLHEEVSKRAAANCLISSGNQEKYQKFKAETLAS